MSLKLKKKGKGRKKQKWMKNYYFWANKKGTMFDSSSVAHQCPRLRVVGLIPHATDA